MIGMTIKQERVVGGSERGTTLMAACGLLGALAASSCCILPVVLFSLGNQGRLDREFHPACTLSTVLSHGHDRVSGNRLLAHPSRLATACIEG